jgi:tol-pal system protein YbgF
MRLHKVRKAILVVAMAALLGVSSVPAHAVSKETIELQTQVQQLLNMVQTIQSTLDAKFGVLQHLAEQTADAANQMTVTVNNLQKQMETQTQAANARTETVSGQVQALNDSVDELKTRIAKLDKSIQDLQNQIQQLQSQPAQTGAPGGLQGAPPTSGGQLPSPQGAASGPALQGPQAPPLEGTYQAGVRDFSAGRYPVAAGEFEDVVHYYPLDDLAGGAKFYLGEIAYQQQNYNEAVNDYNAVLEGFSGNEKAPAAQLHKGFALLAMNKKDAGVRELRSLIQRYPQKPEARAARSKLNGMGIKVATTAER